MQEMVTTEMCGHIPEVTNENITSNINVIVLKKRIIHDWFISINQIKIEPFRWIVMIVINSSENRIILP